ncbi:S8 family serine peptidase [bacterium]|nr:S8 family serine peptidase [bacterium]
MKKLGVIPVFPAGNTGDAQKISLSAGLPHAMSIGSISKNGTPSSFSTKAQVEWEGITYDKPELFAPGENILSVFPNQAYGKISSTSCSSNFVAAIIGLIQEKNPKLTPKRIREILLQTTHRLSDGQKTHIVDAYQAINLASFGGLVKGLIYGPEMGTKILVQPGDMIFESKSTGSFNFFLLEGEYELTFISKGFRNFKQKLLVKRKKTNSLMVDLQKSLKHSISINIWDQHQTAIKGVISIGQNSPQLYHFNNGKIEVKLFEGLYRGKIEVMGLKDQSFYLNVDREKDQFDYQISQIPPILIIKDAKENEQSSYLEQSLKSLNLKYQLQNHSITSQELLAYDIVFWMTESESFDTLSQKEQILLEKYIHSGGRVILSGENLAYHLNSTSFLNKICGLSLLNDNAKKHQIIIHNQITALKNSQSSDWYFPDSLKKEVSSAQSILNYTSGESAAIFNRYHTGATILLGFSLNSIPQESERNHLISQLLETIQPKLQEQIQRIQTLYNLDQKAYFQFVHRFNENTRNNKQEIKEELRKFDNKRGLQPLLEKIFYLDEETSSQQELY